MLLTGDLETRGEEAVLQRLQKEHDISSYTVLKVAHHGSKNSTSAKFLECLKPKVALISCGEKNRYGHPHTETLERLTNAGCDFFTTSEYGTITIEYEHNFHLKSNIRKNLLKFM